MPNESERPSHHESPKHSHSSRRLGEQVLGTYSSPDNPEENEVIISKTFVNFLKDLYALTFTNSNGENVYPLQKLDRDATMVYNHFRQIYASLGPGTHSIAKAISNRVINNNWQIKKSLETLNDHMPPNLFHKTDDEIVLGNIEINSRNATEAEVAEFDKGKLDLTNFDHAIVKTGEKHYFLPLQFSESIVAARVIEVLAASSTEAEGSLDDISAIVWRLMPIRERRVALSNPRNATGSSRFIKPAVLSVLQHFTNALSLTREPSGERFKVLNDVTLTYSKEPVNPRIVEELDLHPVGPSFTHKYTVLQLMGDELPQAVLQQAHESLQIINERLVSHEKAERVLSFIMSPLGKRAIREIFKPTDDIPTPTSARSQIERVIKASLREGFEDAHLQRIVGGFRGGGVAAQVGGRLSANKTKWYIGLSRKEQEQKRTEREK